MKRVFYLILSLVLSISLTISLFACNSNDSEKGNESVNENQNDEKNQDDGNDDSQGDDNSENSNTENENSNNENDSNSSVNQDGNAYYDEENASIGLEYTLSSDESYYIVSGIGTCTDTDIVIPSTYNGLPITSIDKFAFFGCDKLTSVKIPNSITSIGIYAFAGCTKLQYNEYDNAYYIGNSNNPYLVLIKAKNEEIISCNIKENTKIINHAAFNDCISITNITIPNSVSFIGNNAFEDCQSLKDITIPENVTFINDHTFYNCINLTNITIPDGITAIGNYAFVNCRSLKNITIPENATIINDYAFYNCTNLANITIPDGITVIGNYAFFGCEGLASINIPNSVITIGNYAFRYCNIESVHITDIESWCNISFGDSNSNPLIYGSGKLYLNGELLTTLIIPEKITEIKKDAFINCISITDIVIPNSVISIRYSFGYCVSLKKIYYVGTSDDWERINIDGGNKNLINATRYYYSKTEPTEDGNFWHYDENGKIAIWE